MHRTKASSSSGIRTVQLSSLETAARQFVQERESGRRTARTIAHAGADIRMFARRMATMALVVLMTLFYPAGIYAEGAETPSSETPQTTELAPTPPPAETPPPASAPAPEATPSALAPVPAPMSNPEPAPQPAPTDPKKYVYNPQTGMWENDTYAWDPVTKKTKPKTQQKYSFNSSTGHWDTTEYKYDPGTNKYVPNKNSSNNAALSVPISAGNADAVPSGHTFDSFYDASISNHVNSDARSGDASVAGNTFGGSALTGDAAAMAYIINLLQSSTSFMNGSPITTFSADIKDNWMGDLLIDPGVLSALQPATTTDGTDVAIHVDQNGRIDNNITLNAVSGGAKVEGNTSAGDATSGNAAAVANVVNMMNSAINSGNSFMGMLNIYGNLDGDILLPQGVIDTLLASNATAPPTTQLSTGNIENSEVLAQFNDKQAINNNINTTASSGDATVDHNTIGGSAQTGTASTNVTVLNMTGKQIVGANSLLVFVNVLGKWVGVIMDAPTGTTSAALGGGITQNTSAVSANIRADGDQQINNDINVGARTGDADVTDNTRAGDAKTGDAKAGANIANIMNSSLNLSNWFGVLFINVFGSWNGSFGKDTSAGGLAAQPGVQTAAATTGGSDNVKVFRFVPTGNGTQRLEPTQFANVGADVSEPPAPAVAAATTINDQMPVKIKPQEPQMPTPSTDWVIPALGFFAGGSLLGTERIVSNRQRRRGIPKSNR